MPDIKLILVGYGYEQQRLKKIVKERKLLNVEFAGRKSGRELIKEYKSAHLFVLPSASEGQPLTLMEAQAAALPVIATRVGGVPEIVKNNVNGLLIAPGKPKLLAKAIIKVLSSQNIYSRESLLNSQAFYSWEKVSKLTYNAYESLIK